MVSFASRATPFTSSPSGPSATSFMEDGDFSLQHQFTDSISCLEFAPQSREYQVLGFKVLAAGAWDGLLQAYKVAIVGTKVESQPLGQVKTEGPVLGICWQPDAPFVLVAHSDCTIKKWDPMSDQIVSVGSHSAPVKDVYCFQHQGHVVVVSGGWDSRVKFWTWENPGLLKQIGEAYLAKPVHYMSGTFPLLVTAHSNLHFHYWNLEKVFQGEFNPQGIVDSPLKYATSALKCFHNGKGFAVGSIEGRCGVKYIDLPTDKTDSVNEFCFKSHRVDKETSPSILFTMTAISFNTKYGTFATFGNDGFYYVWNKETRSRLKTSKAAPYPLTAGSFLEDGSLLAFAYGYDYSRGAEEMKKKQFPVFLHVRKLKQDEIYKLPGR